MIDFLKDWCLNIVTLVIFIVILEMLLPSGKMKKMINLVSGLILVIALINPILGLLKKGVDLEDYQMVNSNFIDKREIMVNSEVLKEEQTRQITNVYRKKIINQLVGLVKEVKGVINAKVDVIINEDYSDKNFGEVKKVYLELRLGETDEDVKNIKTVKSVEKVTVGNGKKDEKEETSDKRIDNGIRTQIENKIEKILNIQKENIIISLY
jgi:stage III sporulation protein AF